MPRIAVVAAAIVQDGLVLAARRSRPAQLAGRWEFPGGKVEPGESPAAALVRECREELGVGVDVGRVLATASDERIALTLFAATLRAGRPEAGEAHDALQWVDAGSVGALDWLPIDLDLVPAVRRHLDAPV